MKRITITVINDLYTDQRVHRMAGSLVKEGFEVVLIGRKLRNSQGLKDFQFQYRRFKMLFTKGPFFYLFYNLRLFFFLLFFSKPALFISVDLDTLLANRIISKLRKTPLIYDSHEYFTEVPELVNRPLVKKIWIALEGRLLPGINHAISVSDSISNIYKEKYGVDFQTIRNVSLRREPLAFPEFHEKYRSKYKLIYQGALNIGRGIELLMETMEGMNDTMLFIAGEGDISETLRKSAIDSGLEDRIVFTGRVSPSELHKITSQCDLGFSLEEDLGMNYQLALPNKIFDYIQAQVPVLCSDLPEMATLIKSYEVGEVCVERSPEKLAEQIQNMLKNEGLKSKWKLNLKIAASELCWENEEVKLKSVVFEAIETAEKVVD